MCRIGGGPSGVCEACRFAAAQSRQNHDIGARVLRLEQEVLELKEVVAMLRQSADKGSK